MKYGHFMQRRVPKRLSLLLGFFLLQAIPFFAQSVPTDVYDGEGLLVARTLSDGRRMHIDWQQHTLQFFAENGQLLARYQDLIELNLSSRMSKHIVAKTIDGRSHVLEFKKRTVVEDEHLGHADRDTLHIYGRLVELQS